MVDLPILFSAPMVRAILREIEQPGTGKTQTRRVLNPQPRSDMDLIGIYAPRLTAVFGYGTPDADCKVPLRYVPGDRLYVREAWRTIHANDRLPPRNLVPDISKITYEADPENRNPLWAFGKFRQAMHMPRWASRITLIVTDVRVQRLQEISEADAKAEGVGDYLYPASPHGWREAFAELWDSLNAERGFGWEANPWVAAYTFRPILGNVDALETAAA